MRLVRVGNFPKVTQLISGRARIDPLPDSMSSILEHNLYLEPVRTSHPSATAVALESIYEPNGALRVLLGTCVCPDKEMVSFPLGVDSYVQWPSFLPKESV